MYVRRSIMYENAAFCSPEDCSSVAQQSVPLKFDKLCFLQEFYSQVNKAWFVLQQIAKISSFQVSLAWRIIAVISLPFKLVMVLAWFPITSS